MDHAAIRRQVRENLHYLSGDKVLRHKGARVPFAPAEVVEDVQFSDTGGGMVDDYSWSAACHQDDFGSRPQVGDVVRAEGQDYEIARIGRVRETGEVVLHFANPSA